MPPTDGPYANCNFVVEIDGIAVAGFAECTGLGATVDVIAYREGGDVSVRKLPGLRKFTNITLRRGVMQAHELFDWFQNVANGTPDRRNGVVVLLDAARVPVVRWKFHNAFPCEWQGPGLDAAGHGVALETFVLCCESVTRA